MPAIERDDSSMRRPIPRKLDLSSQQEPIKDNTNSSRRNMSTYSSRSLSDRYISNQFEDEVEYNCDRKSRMERPLPMSDSFQTYKASSPKPYSKNTKHSESDHRMNYSDSPHERPSQGFKDKETRQPDPDDDYATAYRRRHKDDRHTSPLSTWKEDSVQKDRAYRPSDERRPKRDIHLDESGKAVYTRYETMDGDTDEDVRAKQVTPSRELPPYRSRRSSQASENASPYSSSTQEKHARLSRRDTLELSPLHSENHDLIDSPARRYKKSSLGRKKDSFSRLRESQESIHRASSPNSSYKSSKSRHDGSLERPSVESNNRSKYEADGTHSASSAQENWGGPKQNTTSHSSISRASSNASLASNQSHPRSVRGGDSRYSLSNQATESDAEALRKKLYEFRKRMRDVFGAADEMIDAHRDSFKSDPATGIPQLKLGMIEEAERRASQVFSDLSELRSSYQVLAKKFAKAPLDDAPAPSFSRKSSMREKETKNSDNYRSKLVESPSNRPPKSDASKEGKEEQRSRKKETDNFKSTDSDESESLALSRLSNKSSSNVQNSRESGRKDRHVSSLASKSTDKQDEPNVKKSRSISTDHESDASKTRNKQRPLHSPSVFKDFDRRMEELRGSLNAIAEGRRQKAASKE